MPKNFKVVIAGGSIAGLTLANMLEQVGIDFVVLEAYPEIAPQVGASIGLFPNGLRIYEQLGCYSALMALVDKPLDCAYFRNSTGKPLMITPDVDKHITKRHGYPVIFLDRQMVIQVLYDNLKDKSKVKVNKRVEKITHLSSEVQVRTKDGDSFTGDILFGCDGIHSTVRREMWRLADELQPGYIPKTERSAMPCDYKCIFGISIMNEFEAASVHNTLNEHYSYLVVTGPRGRVYWFFFVNLGKTHYGDEIPRFTKQDEEELAKKHSNDKVTENVTFGEIYADRISSVLTALPEYVFKKWYFKRIFTLGDAAHKFEPLSGQGGNSAIETAASIVNALTRRMKQYPAPLTDAEIESAFDEVQTLRSPRVSRLVEASHKQQTVEAMENPLLKAIAEHYLPRCPVEARIYLWAESFHDAISLEMIDKPTGNRFSPYDDELQNKPLKSSPLPKLAVAAVLAALFYISQYALQVFESDGSSRTHVRESYTGIPAVDSILKLLVLAFSGAISGNNPNQLLHSIYFLVNLIPAIQIWIVEGYRVANFYSYLYLPSIFFTIFQLVGIGKIAPLYYLVSVFATRRGLHTRTVNRPVPAWVAKAILPALSLGYVVPTILMYLPWESQSLKETIIAFWQPSPVYVSVLTAAISYGIWRSQHSNESRLAAYSQPDVAPLKEGYAFTFAATAITHFSVVALFLLSPSLSLLEAFLEVPNPFSLWYQGMDAETYIFVFFKYDMLLYVASNLVWSLYSVYELRRAGFVSSSEAVRAAWLVVIGQFVVGPGAAFAGLWYWREMVISSQAILVPEADDK